MGCTVRELLARMGADELAEWAAYYRLEPFGEWRGDVRSAQICATIANANRGRGAAYRLEQFMIEFGEGERERPTVEQMRRALLFWTASRGGVIERR